MYSRAACSGVLYESIASPLIISSTAFKAAVAGSAALLRVAEEPASAIKAALTPPDLSDVAHSSSL